LKRFELEYKQQSRLAVQRVRQFVFHPYISDAIFSVSPARRSKITCLGGWFLPAVTELEEYNSGNKSNIKIL